MKTIKIDFPTDNHTKNFLVLSDLHLAETKDIQKINKLKRYIANHVEIQKIDAFFLVGDLIDSTDALHNTELKNALIEFVEFLSMKAKTYIAVGNHDLCSRRANPTLKKWWRKDETTFEKEFTSPISKLKNVFIASGTYDLDREYTVSIYNPPLEYMLNAADGNPRYLTKNEWGYAFLNKLDEKKTNILLCHYPNAIKTLHKKGTLAKVDLAVAGHNHNGMTQFLFIEHLLNVLGFKNRGIITPGKSFNLNDTSRMRGLITLDERTSLYINPAVTSLSANTGLLKHLDSLFYTGMTKITFKTKE